MEVILKQQLHQRKISQTDTVQSLSVLPGITTITPPPTSSSQSDKYAFESEGSTSHRVALQMQSPLTDNGQRRDEIRRSNSSITTDLVRRPAEAIDSSKTYDRPYRRIQPERVFTHRSTSPPQTPPGSPRRARSTSPVANFDTGIHIDPDRGRTKAPRSMDNDNAASVRSRSSSHSRRSRSLSDRSRSMSRGSRYSRSSSSYRDGMVVERLTSSRSRSRSPSVRNSDKWPHKEDLSEHRAPDMSSRQSRVDSTPLKHRISDLYPHSATKRSKRRVCPFFHPRDNDKHGLHEPHPGYSLVEFDEAVRIHETGRDLPPHLIKAGVGVNLQNKGSPTRPSAPTWIGRVGTSPTTTRGVPIQRTSFSAENFRAEPPAKRRKVEPRERQESYRHDGGTLYPPPSHPRASGPMPQQGNYAPFQYHTAPRTSNDRPTRPVPRAINSDPPRGMKPNYRRHPPSYPRC